MSDNNAQKQDYHELISPAPWRVEPITTANGQTVYELQDVNGKRIAVFNKQFDAQIASCSANAIDMMDYMYQFSGEICQSFADVMNRVLENAGLRRS